MDFDRMNRRRRMEQFRDKADWMDVIFVVCIVGFIVLSVVWVAHELSTIG